MILTSHIKHKVYLCFYKNFDTRSFQLIFQRDMIQIAAPTMTSPAPNIASNIQKVQYTLFLHTPCYRNKFMILLSSFNRFLCEVG